MFVQFVHWMFSMSQKLFNRVFEGRLGITWLKLFTQKDILFIFFDAIHKLVSEKEEFSMTCSSHETMFFVTKTEMMASYHVT